MQCWVCRRQARGHRHSDLRFRVGDPRRHPPDWAFCSRRCQDAFHAMYGAWRKTEPPLSESLTREAHMPETTAQQRAAMRRCLRPFGQVAGEIGFDKPLAHYAEEEALRVIGAIVSAYTEAMAPNAPRAQAASVGQRRSVGLSADAFADLEDDIPW
ncbi:DUF6511 domain-containing protein [Ralstonia pseudosolanacearum]|uniref:DUF6511 domain-containing protein n=2 Tax=Ralstonia pseudosolanacearum TaxID=1310165 RepID=UPI0013C2D5AA|nr:hypothetical protein HI802_23885 [Ralstonia solanacearum]UNJ31774.1 DUF6511 domain-containing protein [Ralstonia pseudosolanacearum]QKM00144.1 hypothetical protein HI801_23895 [Ralstonia solanacearum]QLR10652.1 hypothetical protein H1A20_22340 [Ralstonia solanacearum]USS51825.1 DUF6511 domain-containing protein [Ralstonia solanacearum]